MRLDGRVLLLAVVGVTGCSVQQPPTAAPSSVVLATPAPGEAQDPCTQVALSLLDGQLEALPSADPAALTRANDVVAAFVARYDAVITSAGVPAARARFAPEVGAACAASASPVPSPS